MLSVCYLVSLSSLQPLDASLEKCGLNLGDVIIKLNGISTIDMYPSQFYGVYSENIGHTIHLEVLFVVVGVCV